MSSHIWPLGPSIVAFILAACVIGYGGVLLTIRAERLAQVTGLGELLTGAVLIGAVTSLSGLVTSITAAHAGHASLAVSNSLGGIAAQTTFLVIADMAYRQANLEHAAASEPNLLQGAMLIALLALPMLAMASPDIAVLGVHPISIVIVAAYLFGLWLIREAREHPMWHPQITRETRPEGNGKAVRPRQCLMLLWLSFVLLAVVVGGAGWTLARAAISVSMHVGLAETVVGGLLTAITTSLPELVVAVVAVRRGALALAVGDILGGNAFDVLFLSAADAAYRNGSIYAAISMKEVFWAGLAILLVGVLLLGLLRREKHGLGNIGFESVLVLVLYLLGIGMLVAS